MRPGIDLKIARCPCLNLHNGAGNLPEAFLPTLASAFAVEAQFNAYGFEPIRTAWLKRAANIGQMITARTQRDEYMGRFDSVDQSGHLILDTTDGRRAIAAADIYF